MTKPAAHTDVTRAHAKIASLEERVAELEKLAHEPFDFTDVINRLTARITELEYKVNP